MCIRILNKLKLISLIKICAFTVFLGRAYQLYFFGAPFRAILWDESLLTPIVEGLFNYTWFDYATSPRVNSWIDGSWFAVGYRIITDQPLGPALMTAMLLQVIPEPLYA